MEVSERSTLIEFCESILQACREVYQKAPLSEVHQRVRQLITACGILMLVIDETQHLVDRSGNKTYDGFHQRPNERQDSVRRKISRCLRN